MKIPALLMSGGVLPGFAGWLQRLDGVEMIGAGIEEQFFETTGKHRAGPHDARWMHIEYASTDWC
jgi:hypothetical protein